MGTHYAGTPREVLALDTFIKLVRATSTLNSRLHGPMLAEHGLTASQLGVLETLLHLGPMPQTRLCAKLLMSGSNLTTVIDNLERNAWVRRQRDTADRRVQNVHLTDAGRSLIERVLPSHVARITEALGALTREEQKELGRLCRKLGLAAAG
jgi:MarR family 2-MHQ and catechol resistance regulon transcriptional repressor